jgi:hypothetical protein
MTYNPPGHPVHKAASKIKEVAIPLLAELKAAVLANSPIEQVLKPHRQAWAVNYHSLGQSIPPFPEAEILHELLGPSHEPIDNLEAHPDVLAMLDEPLEDGSGQTFLDSLFDYRYEVEPEPEPEPAAVPATGQTNGKGKGKAREDGRTLASGSTRIRLRVQDPTPSGDTPVRQSSRKRPRETSTTPSPSGDSRRPSLAESVASETVEDPAVAEKRRMFTNFEQPTILPEGTRRRAAAAYVPPRPINQALAATQQEQNRKKASQRREKVIVPQSFVPNVKVAKRRPKGDKSASSSFRSDGNAGADRSLLLPTRRGQEGRVATPGRSDAALDVRRRLRSFVPVVARLRGRVRVGARAGRLRARAARRAPCSRASAEEDASGLLGQQR